MYLKLQIYSTNKNIFLLKIWKFSERVKLGMLGLPQKLLGYRYNQF